MGWGLGFGMPVSAMRFLPYKQFKQQKCSNISDFETRKFAAFLGYFLR